jgi:hypothetical protein
MRMTSTRQSSDADNDCDDLWRAVRRCRTLTGHTLVFFCVQVALRSHRHDEQQSGSRAATAGRLGRLEGAFLSFYSP